MNRAPNETNTRIVFETSYAVDEGVVFATDEAGGVTVNVSEEQAVDSYNDSFTCTATLTHEQTAELLKWLTDALQSR